MKNILVNGLIWGSKEPLMPPVDRDEFVSRLLNRLASQSPGWSRETLTVLNAHMARRAFEFRTPDLNDFREAKWALLLPGRTPETEDIAARLQPLVTHRQGRTIFLPTSSHSTILESWPEDVYLDWDDAERPYYLLLAGPPTSIPFQIQYRLDVHAAVGRLSFHNPEDYSRYAEKVVAFETTPEAMVERKALFFATEHSGDNATWISRNYMTDPLVKMLKSHDIPVSYSAGDEATLTKFKFLISGTQGHPAPAIVYTATHGLGVTGTDEEAERNRRAFQGAIVCQDYDGYSGIFAADTVPESTCFHGSIFIMFACYGAGTPKESDFFHWKGDDRLLRCRPQMDFIAALPNKLLAHPKGPLAFFGHIDPAWVYSFADMNHVANDQGRGTRMAPFRLLVSQLLKGACVGYAAKRFGDVYSSMCVKLSSLCDQFRRKQIRKEDPKWTETLIDTWMTRNDTQNFILLGDPAVRVKMN